MRAVDQDLRRGGVASERHLLEKRRHQHEAHIVRACTQPTPRTQSYANISGSVVSLVKSFSDLLLKCLYTAERQDLITQTVSSAHNAPLLY